MNDALRNALADLRACGPHFAWAGLRSRRSRAPLETLALSSGERIAFRPRQSDFPALRQVFRNLEYHLPTDVAARVGRGYQRMLAAGSVPVIVDAGFQHWRSVRLVQDAVPPGSRGRDRTRPGERRARAAQRLRPARCFRAGGGSRREPGFVAVLPAEHAWAVKTERAEKGCAIVTIDQAVAAVPSARC